MAKKPFSVGKRSSSQDAGTFGNEDCEISEDIDPMSEHLTSQPSTGGTQDVGVGPMKSPKKPFTLK